MQPKNVKLGMERNEIIIDNVHYMDNNNIKILRHFEWYAYLK